MSNLREIGDALRSNAERLLSDVQTIHRRMVAEIDREERALGLASSSAPRRPSPERHGGRAPRDSGGDDLDVPEFIPPG